MSTASLGKAVRPDRFVDEIATAAIKLGLPVNTVLSVERVHFSRRRAPVICYQWTDQCGNAGQLYGEVIGQKCVGYAREESIRLRKKRRNQWVERVADPVVAVPGVGVVLRTPGVDARLPGLKVLHDRGLATRIACQALGIAPTHGRQASVQLRAHRLGKRAVLQVDVPDSHRHRRVFLRLSTASSLAAEQRFHVHRQIGKHLTKRTAEPALLIPDPLLFDPELRAAIYSALPGEPAAVARLDDATLASAGYIALLRLSRLQCTLGERYDPARELSVLVHWHGLLQRYCPDLVSDYGRALERIQRRFQTQPFPEFGVCHRDLHDGQILVSPDGVGLIDFDTLCQSDPAIDAGNLLAHRYFRDLCAKQSDTCHRERLYALLACDRNAEQLTRIRFWESVSLLRVAAIHMFCRRLRAPVAQAIDRVLHD